MRTYWTPCRASVLRIRFGSSGARFAPGAPLSGTVRTRQEFAQVLDFLEPLLGREPQDARHVLQHVGPHNDARFELRVHFQAEGGEQLLQRLPARTRSPLLDAGNDGLGCPGAARPRPLTETRPRPG